VPSKKIPSEQPAGSFRLLQCFYWVPEFSSSVSVALGIPLTTDNKRSGPRQYWQRQFNREEREEREERGESGEKKDGPPKRLAGLGEEAFWVGDPLTGALYVLRGEVFLRLSVGGPPGQSQRIKRARTLAIYALKRLDTGGRASAR
jgi:hypothetical protein